MANLVPKVSAKQWLDEACDLLIREGVAGVKIGALAKQIGVSRGGFYYHFGNRAKLLQRILERWQQENIFFQAPSSPLTPQEARQAFYDGFVQLIDEDRFCPNLDRAIRAWGNIDPQVRALVYQVDSVRIGVFRALFASMGYSIAECHLRSEMLYMHQMGIYALDIHTRRTVKERKQEFDLYMRILIGETGISADS